MKLALVVLLLVAAGCNPFAEDIAIATARECDAMAALSARSRTEIGVSRVSSAQIAAS
jgi:hypothetical protein